MVLATKLDMNDSRLLARYYGIALRGRMSIRQLRGKALENGSAAFVLMALSIALGWMLWPYKVLG